jgi:hypothetical protein
MSLELLNLILNLLMFAILIPILFLETRSYLSQKHDTDKNN